MIFDEFDDFPVKTAWCGLARPGVVWHSLAQGVKQKPLKGANNALNDAAGCWLQLLAAGAVAAAVASPIIAQFGLFFRGVLKLVSRGGLKLGSVF